MQRTPEKREKRSEKGLIDHRLIKFPLKLDLESRERISSSSVGGRLSSKPFVVLFLGRIGPIGDAASLLLIGSFAMPDVRSVGRGGAARIGLGGRDAPANF